MGNLWNTKPSKLGYKFSKETIKKLDSQKLRIHHKDCKRIRVGGIGKTNEDLLRNLPRDKWICHKDCCNKEI